LNTLNWKKFHFFGFLNIIVLEKLIHKNQKFFDFYERVSRLQLRFYIFGTFLNIFLIVYSMHLYFLHLLLKASTYFSYSHSKEMPLLLQQFQIPREINRNNQRSKFFQSKLNFLTGRPSILCFQFIKVLAEKPLLFVYIDNWILFSFTSF